MSTGQTRVAIIGATGYAGAELVRLLSQHPFARVTDATSGRAAGQRLSQHVPWISSDLQLSAFDPDTLDADVVFFCQEAGFAMAYAASLIGRMKVIDLSADFRLSDPAQYEAVYRKPHAAPDLLPAAYGLVEFQREKVAGSRLVANPGCYPTATLLGLLPLAKAGLIPEGAIPVVDAKSGVSGAGRARTETDYTFSELSGGFKAYAATGHRHVPEIEEQVGIPVRFTPHLVPMARGLEATLHIPTLARSLSEIREVYESAYSNEPFVQVCDSLPNTKQVMGSNRCDLCVGYDDRLGFAVISSVIDNLVKGAAGQAIQNMNVMLGFPETAGLPLNGVWP